MFFNFIIQIQYYLIKIINPRDIYVENEVNINAASGIEQGGKELI